MRGEQAENYVSQRLSMMFVPHDKVEEMLKVQVLNELSRSLTVELLSSIVILCSPAIAEYPELFQLGWG